MPDTPTQPSPPEPVRDPNKPKYTDEQKAKAEDQARADAAKRLAKQDKFVDDTAKKLVEFLENEDANTRTSIVDRIVQRVSSIRTVAANAHLRTSRFAVQKEEDKSMPRVVTGDIRNIMGQADQNKTKELGGGK